MRKLTTSILLFLFFLSVKAQVASYSFENNLNDNIGTNHAEFLVFQNMSSSTPTYIDGTSGKKIKLDKYQGLRISKNIFQNHQNTSSIEIHLELTLDEFGDNPEIYNKFFSTSIDGVINNNTGGGMHLVAELLPDETKYAIHFVYGDGINTNSLGLESWTIARDLEEGQKIDIKLILDFGINQWFAIVNGKFTSALFNTDEVNIEEIRKSFIEKDIHINYAIGDFSSDEDLTLNFLSIDNLKIYGSRQAGDTNLLNAALTAVTNHINETQSLTETQLAQYLEDIRLNLNQNFAASETEIYNLTNAYEAKNEPIFNSLDIIKIDTLPIETQIVIFLQQYIFDFEYDDPSAMSGVKFEVAESYPGKVEDTAPRLNNVNVEINGTYSKVANIKTAFDNEDVKRPLGYYLAAGDVATVTIPNTYINAGLKVMVGKDESDMGGSTNRMARISKKYNLDSETTTIANPFGGGLYITAPEGSSLGWINITLNNVVKSPYFSTRTGRATDLSDWQTQLNNNSAPWVDLESDKFMMSLPTSHILEINLTNPTELMQYWDNIKDGYRYLGGRPFARNKPEYFSIDSKLPGSGFGTGYPQVLGLIGDKNMWPTSVLNANFHQTEFFITLHEFGHLALHPTLPLEVETIVNLPAVYIYNTYFNLTLEESFQNSLGDRLTFDQAMMDWLVAENFINNNTMDCAPNTVDCGERPYQSRGHAKYGIMAQLFGWEAVHKMNKYFYDLDVNNNTSTLLHLSSDDDIIKAASLGNTINMMPLFHFWGLIPSESLKTELSSLPTSQIILNYLNDQKAKIPTTKEEFQPYYDVLYPVKHHTLRPRLDYVLNNYETDDFHTQISNQIDLIINTYFSNLRTEEYLKQAIKLYPNPSNNLLQLDLTSLGNKNIVITINDYIGREVLKKDEIGGSIKRLSIRNFSKGLYLLRVKVDNERITYKFIKE